MTADPKPCEAGAMLTSIGRVTELRDAGAWLELEAPSACTTCASGGGCGSIARLGMRRAPWCVFVDVPAGTQRGDRLVIGLPQACVVQAAAIAYGLPLLAIVGGSLLATALGAGDVGTILGAGIGLGLGLLWARRHSRTLAQAGRLTPVLLGPAGDDTDTGKGA